LIKGLVNLKKISYILFVEFLSKILYFYRLNITSNYKNTENR